MARRCRVSVVISWGMCNSGSREVFLISTKSLSPIGDFLLPYLQGLLAEIHDGDTSAVTRDAVSNLVAAIKLAFRVISSSVGGLKFVGLAQGLLLYASAVHPRMRVCSRGLKS